MFNRKIENCPKGSKLKIYGVRLRALLDGFLLGPGAPLAVLGNISGFPVLLILLQKLRGNVTESSDAGMIL